MSEMKKSRRKYSKEYKREIVEQVLSGAKSASQIATEQGMPESSVYAWLKQAKVDRGEGVSGALTSAEKEELRALRKENRALKKERDFLQCATAYFAKASK